MRRQWLYTQAMFCICKISQDWMQRNSLAKHSKSLDEIAMEKHSRILWCFVASHPQYCQYIFPFPDVSKNFFPLRAVQLVHTAECRHNAEEYKPQIVCRTVVIDTEYEIKLLTHKRHPISRQWGRAMVCLLWECLEKQRCIANYNITLQQRIGRQKHVAHQAGLCRQNTSTIFFFWGRVAKKVVSKFEKDPQIVVYVR